jgi:hypothetical protein
MQIDGQKNMPEQIDLVRKRLPKETLAPVEAPLVGSFLPSTTYDD